MKLYKLLASSLEKVHPQMKETHLQTYSNFGKSKILNITSFHINL